MNEIRMHLNNFIIIVMDNLFCYSKLLQLLDSIILSKFAYFFIICLLAFLMSNLDIQWKERIIRG